MFCSSELYTGKREDFPLNHKFKAATKKVYIHNSLIMSNSLTNLHLLKCVQICRTSWSKCKTTPNEWHIVCCVVFLCIHLHIKCNLSFWPVSWTFRWANFVEVAHHHSLSSVFIAHSLNGYEKAPENAIRLNYIYTYIDILCEIRWMKMI